MNMVFFICMKLNHIFINRFIVSLKLLMCIHNLYYFFNYIISLEHTNSYIFCDRVLILTSERNTVSAVSAHRGCTLEWIFVE